MAKWVGRGAEVLVWWSLLVGVWVLTLSSVSTSDMAAATGSSFLCAVAVVAGREAAGGAWHPSPRWAGWLLRLPVVVIIDTVGVFVAALRQLGDRTIDRDPGELRTAPIPATGNPARYAARQALATIAVSTTPGTYVADVDEEHAVLLVHALVPGGPSMEEAVGR